MKLSSSLTDAIEDARATIRVGYPWWLGPWLARDVIAITLGRTIFLGNAAASRPPDRLEPLVRHELAHVRQVARHGLVRFLLLYLAEFFRHWRTVRSVQHAYSLISFEIEALAAEQEGERLSR